MTTDTRAEFESAYIAHLKQQWPLNKCTPQDLAVMREGDGYGDGASHLAGAWWGWRAASVLGGEVVAWMRTYRQFRDSQSEAPDPGYMVTSFHQNAEIAAKYPDENVPLYAHPAPSAPAQALLASKPAVALGEELRSMLTRAYNAGWDASDACDNAYNNGNSERLETEIPQAHEPAVYQRWRATWFSNRDEVLRAIAASAAPAQSCGEPCEVDKYSSRACERGTLSCDVEHSQPAQSGGDPILALCGSPDDAEATIWRWKTSWGDWTYRKELPAGWRDLPSIQGYRIASAEMPRQSCGDAEQADEAEFKNFHRILCERFGYVHDEADWKRDQLSLIEHIAAKQSDEQHEWISVEDRMPDADVPVLVHNGRWTGVGAWMSDKHLEEIERWQDEQREFIELSGPAVTHWMPLPAALAARAKDSK